MTKQQETFAVLIGETLVHVVVVSLDSKLSEGLEEVWQQKSNSQLASLHCRDMSISS
jgi:hypothetical protein